MMILFLSYIVLVGAFTPELPDIKGDMTTNKLKSQDDPALPDIKGTIDDLIGDWDVTTNKLKSQDDPALPDINGIIDDLIGDWDVTTNKLKSQDNSDWVGGERRILPPQLEKSRENDQKRLSIWDDLQKSMKRIKSNPKVPDNFKTLALDRSILK